MLRIPLGSEGMREAGVIFAFPVSVAEDDNIESWGD